jgi:iron complex outermembrane receptor protein
MRTFDAEQHIKRGFVMFMRANIYRAGMYCGVALTAAMSATAVAQTTSTETGIADQTLEEIVVTSQRRVENLQDVPIAVTALDADALKSNAVARLADLQTASPSLSITTTGQTLSVNIRGIGLASNSPNSTAGIATYVDGLFQPSIVQANSFYDLASVEVLRGPQGTLVGTNSTGGAIFINSNSPTFDGVNGYAQTGFGNYRTYEAEAAVNLPASDSLAFRVAGFKRHHDSYYTDAGPFHNEAGKLDENGGRLGMLWKPGAFSALGKLQLNDMQTGGYAYRPLLDSRFEDYRVGDIRTLSYDTPTSHRERALIGSLELRYEFDSGIVLRSLSGYQHKRMFSLDDIDGAQVPIAVGGDISWDYFAAEKQYSEEINVISPTDGPLDWIVGAYYQRHKIDVNVRETQGGFPTDIIAFTKRRTTGLFAQTNYEITQALELQVGARYSTFEADGTGSVFIGAGIPGFPAEGAPVADLGGSHEDSETTGKVALNWRLDDDNLLYVFTARGYKPGGFNSTESEFKPETILNYELGWKSTLFDGHLRTQVAAFYNDYSDFQFDILEPATGQAGVRNVADGTIQGAEMQVEGRFGGLGFNAAAAYVDSKIDGLTFVNQRLLPPGNLPGQCSAALPPDQPCFDYTSYFRTTSGGPSLYSPEWTYNAGVEYTIEAGEDVTITPRVNYSYVGSRYAYIAYSPISDRLDSHGLVSALLTVRKGNWYGVAYGTNLTDKDYVSGQATVSLNEFYGAPREYGVRVGFDF